MVSYLLVYKAFGLLKLLERVISGFLIVELMAKRRAKRRISKRVQKKAKRKWPLVAAATAAITIVTGAYFSKPEYIPPEQTHVVTPENPRPEPTPTQKINVEDIIIRHAVLHEPIVNPGGQGTLYLVGMHHYFTGPGGPINTGKAKQYIPAVQAELYFLLRDFATEADITFVVGEGMPVGEYHASPVVTADFKKRWQNNKKSIDNPSHTPAFFRLNTAHSGYSALAIFHPGLISLWGVDEEIEVQQLHELVVERKQVLAAIETAVVYQLPNLLTHKQSVFLEVKELFDKRSIIYITQGQKLADGQGEEDYVQVVGPIHIPLMLEKYSGQRRIMVLRPKSIPKNNFYGEQNR
jgi:hypothetical protein